MTALAGIWSFAGHDRSRDCARMLAAQRVHAPDPPASWSGPGLAMGRRLFRLLPEDRYDRGPIVSADGRRALVADVRIDNREEIVAALGAPEGGRTLSDAALLMLALERWDEEAIGRLAGDFAFAWWDGPRQRLLLARDFLGSRPLHYHRGDGFFAFASMPKGLHALEEVPRAPNTETVTRFLALMPEGNGESFFKDVQRVPAAHVCAVDRNGVTLRRHWRPSRTRLSLPKAEDYRDALREAFDTAVRAQLRGADGRVATHLSGGLDSSTVTATAARLLGPTGRVAAFTAVPREGYEGPDPRGRFGDEGPLAATLAAKYKQIEHVLIRTGHLSPVAGLDRNFFLFERPVLNLCNGVWIEGIAEAAKQRDLRVLLTGQHGNMSFSYNGMEALPELLARGRLVALARLLRKLPHHGVHLESALSHTIGPFLPAWLWRGINRARGRHMNVTDHSSINPAAAARLRAGAAGAGLDMSYRPRRDPFGTRLWVLDRIDTGNTHKAYLGGWGVDRRDPTGDRRLVELCLSIPHEQFLLDGEPRALARAAFADRLSPEILGETRKGLQAVDWHEGVEAARSAIREEVERFGALPATDEAMDNGMLRRLLENWPTGAWHGDKTMRRYRLALLRGVSAGHFLRKAGGSNR